MNNTDGLECQIFGFAGVWGEGREGITGNAGEKPGF